MTSNVTDFERYPISSVSMLSINLRFLASKIFFWTSVELKWKSKNATRRGSLTGCLAVINNKGLPFQFLLPVSVPPFYRSRFPLLPGSRSSSRAPAPPGLPLLPGSRSPILVRFAYLWNEEINYHKFSWHSLQGITSGLYLMFYLYVYILTSIQSSKKYIERNTQGIHNLSQAGHCLK